MLLVESDDGALSIIYPPSITMITDIEDKHSLLSQAKLRVDFLGKHVEVAHVDI